MARTIQAPGIELREFNKTTYNNRPDYSIVGTTVLVNGFADDGEDLTTQWVNSKQTFEELYGIPTNEPEMYFYNAAMEVLNKGGILVASKLPYDNNSYNKFNCVTYTITKNERPFITNIDQIGISSLSTLDSTLTSVLELKSLSSETIHLSTLDDYKINAQRSTQNTFKIVDISRTKYDSLPTGNFISTIITNTDTNTDVVTNEFLGLIPVITTAANALYYQNKWDTNLSNIQLSTVNVINSLSVMSHNSISACLSNINEPANYITPLITENINDESISKIAIEQFPKIQFLDSNILDKTYLKCIGVVLFKAYQDKSNPSKINFQLVESFVGSLDKTAKHPTTNASLFIDNIINTNSKYINIFSNFEPTILTQCSLLYINNASSYSLGFYKCDLTKKINYQNSIVKPLTTIFERNSNLNKIQIDLVLDAGVSTIAEAIHAASITEFDFTNNPYISDINNTNFVLSGKQNAAHWFNIIKKYDEFCRYTRRDCMFIADCLRTFCLNGNEKNVRPTNIINTVENVIIPKLRYLSDINSSYTAGYCNWFRVIDEYSGDYFWCPPSIKAVGVYLYTDTYFNTWDAPAGIIRGKLKTVIDTAFSPNDDEAGQIYSQCWNYAINYPLDGIVLEGQKTMQLQKTAFDRVNVRRLFLYLERRVLDAAKYFVYEKNTPYLRQRFVDTIRPIFDDIASGNGISDYYIRCDETNNTQQSIDNHELRCQIIVKPIKTIEYIVLDFICTQQNANIVETITKH